jgi:sulfonate transport system substrate-binding protein
VFRISIRLLSLAVAAALTATACGSSASSASSGDGGGGGNAVTLRVGDQNKQLEEPLDLSGQSKGTSYGLQWSNFLDGPHMDAAFAAGKIDVGFLGDSPALLATASGANAVVVGALKFQPNSAYALVAKPGSGITTLADLRGKKVAFTQATALQGYALQALGTVGLTQKDITVVNVPGASLGTTLNPVAQTRPFSHRSY